MKVKKKYWRKYYSNIEVFTNENALSFYLLGAYMTDGCVTTQTDLNMTCRFEVKDKDWVTSIRDLVSPFKPILKLIDQPTLK